MGARQFRKRPVVVEAMQLTNNWREVCDWINATHVGAGRAYMPSGPDLDICIPTLEGEMRALPGDWIIKGVQGEFYPCKPDIFTATYEEVGE